MLLIFTITFVHVYNKKCSSPWDFKRVLKFCASIVKWSFLQPCCKIKTVSVTIQIWVTRVVRILWVLSDLKGWWSKWRRLKISVIVFEIAFLQIMVYNLVILSWIANVVLLKCFSFPCARPKIRSPKWVHNGVTNFIWLVSRV